MCGRYASSRKPEDLVEAFEIDFLSGEGPGRDVTAPVAAAAKAAKDEGTEDPKYPARTPADANFNVAPTTVQPVVLERMPRVLDDADEPDRTATSRRSRSRSGGCAASPGGSCRRGRRTPRPGRG
jgi:putative SOS response-associated peptidase YedK